MKPDGQLPAYKWNFGDVNPPVHAWATFRVFKIERKLYDREDLEFLERVFQKLLLNFTWWPDGTAWMAFYCLNMLNIALELAKHNHVYEASKFFEHFLFISDAVTYKAGDNESNGMYYDAISFGPGNTMQLPVRSLVGLIPLYATMVLEPSVLKCLPGFKKRMEWFIDNRPGVLDRNIANMKVGGRDQRRLLVLASKERLVSLAEDA
ncbi:glycoside hydrolase family 63 protein [Lentinula edodes]|uniref:Glycoside hydrolase family 63 protein n=1 Tax=Lentinula edodes TaxID=5353 RepID=A0A1Q3E6F5_LENED|nr:glycoside hydrolase family 63 protein [Lentinula edodes]